MDKKKHKRPDWDKYFLGQLKPLATRSTCDRGRISAIIVRDKRILTSGYAGAPPGLAHCDEVGHLMEEVTNKQTGKKSEHCVRTIHAEANAIIQAARCGPPINGATLYCKMTPCYRCAMAIIGAGIKRVVCLQDYQDSEESKAKLQEAGVALIIKDKTVKQY
ncbi:MAG: cytidine/deoxycytidylate deaminase family protein [bacterium]